MDEKYIDKCVLQFSITSNCVALLLLPVFLTTMMQTKLELIQEGVKAAKVEDLAVLVQQTLSRDLLVYATPEHEAVLTEARETLEEAALNKNKDVSSSSIISLLMIPVFSLSCFANANHKVPLFTIYVCCFPPSLFVCANTAQSNQGRWEDCSCL